MEDCIGACVEGVRWVLFGCWLEFECLRDFERQNNGEYISVCGCVRENVKEGEHMQVWEVLLSIRTLTLILDRELRMASHRLQAQQTRERRRLSGISQWMCRFNQRMRLDGVCVCVCEREYVSV